MSTRVLISNGVKLALLLPILLGVPRSIGMLCLLGILSSLVVDYWLYRRDKALEPSRDDEPVHVPLPPSRQPRS